MSEIDVVYPVSVRCDEPDHWELRMSLRSLEANFKVRDVYIVGHKPDWLQDVIHLDVGDHYVRNKDGNIIQKILAACCLPSLSNQFVRMSDDQYFLKRQDVSDFCNPVSTNNYDPNSRGLWHKRMKSTIKALRCRGFSSVNYESHCPVVVNRFAFGAAVCDYPFGADIGYCVNTIYFNSIGVSPASDKNRVYVSRREDTYEKIIHGCADSKFLNINGGIARQHKAFLETMFPDASRYEG